MQNFSFDIKFELVGVEEKSYGEPLSKKYLMVFFQMLSPYNKCLKVLMKTIFVHKKKNSVIIIDVIKCLTTSKWFKKYF